MFALGQRPKKHQSSIRCFCYPTLLQTGFDGLGIHPIRFRGAGSSTNQVLRSWELDQLGFEELGVRPIWFRVAGNSANPVSRGQDFGQSGFEGLGVRSIRFRKPRKSANQIFGGWEFSQSGFGGWKFTQLDDFTLALLSNQVLRAGSSTNQVLRHWEFSQSGAFSLPLSSIRVFCGRDLSPSDERSVLYKGRKVAVLLSSARCMAETISLLAYNLTMRVART